MNQRMKKPEMSPADKARLERKIRTIKAYRTLFADGRNEAAKIVMADLEQRLYGAKHSYFPGCGADHMFTTDGMRWALEYIKKRTVESLDNVQLTPEDK